jgi:hypothetical protein
VCDVYIISIDGNVLMKEQRRSFVSGGVIRSRLGGHSLVSKENVQKHTLVAGAFSYRRL